MASLLRVDHPSFVACILLLILFWAPSARSERRCFAVERIQCLLSWNCTDGFHHSFPASAINIPIGRVRFPGTASTDERRLFFAHEEDRLRYDNLPTFGGCQSKTLCFEVDDGIDFTLAFRKLYYTRTFEEHIAYDQVKHKMSVDIETIFTRYTENLSLDDADGGTRQFVRNALNDKVLLTTIRDPASYAAKWYRTRRHFDKVTNLTDARFSEWIDLAPWRMNVVTRVLGAQTDRKTMPTQMLQRLEGQVSSIGDDIEKEAFLQDAYMQEQNELGPSQSMVFRLALARLKNEFSHFGIFHRLQDSWDLLSHRFCWNISKLTVRERASQRGTDAIRHLAKNDTEANDLLAYLHSRNRLDLALLKAAEEIMDQQLEIMHAEKAQGILCNFLGKIEVTCDPGHSASRDLWFCKYICKNAKKYQPFTIGTWSRTISRCHHS